MLADVQFQPGRQVEAVKCAFLGRRGFLWLRLPSGRCLAYGKPQVRDVEVPWADKEQPRNGARSGPS